MALRHQMDKIISFKNVFLIVSLNVSLYPGPSEMWLKTCKQIDSYKKLTSEIDRETVIKIYIKKVLDCIKKFIDYFVQSRSTTIFTYTDGTYEEEYSCWPPAICMILISIAEIVLFCYDAAQGKTDATGPIAQIFIYNPHKRQEAWRFLTYMLVHVGVVHLLVNLLVQLFLGVPLEMVHRWWRVVLVYLAGVAAGSLATSLTDPKVYLAGASGGVYALIAAHIATIIMNWAEMEFAIIQLLVFLLLAAVDVGTAVYDRYWRHLQQNIGYVAHLAGAVAGLLVGIGVLRNLEKRKWEKRLWWAAVVLYFSLMIGGVLANIFWTSHFQTT
ncbi:rhomboid-related protein 2 isoform X5 [Bicyclus anynana]|uniref:Rhomboid-related protein 2 isoform X5 n=1 Tax=Bicyclus anynana TaxID=110368 RepID=A0ABM3LJ42_BICAN|nr:rhomboid-related protein 2 isoform X5 [Bicyclus anynana]